MIVAAAVCPGPPLLLREVTGAQDPAADLRAACALAVRRLVGSTPDAVCVVGPDGPGMTAASFAPRPHRQGAEPRRPLALLVADRLIAAVGWAGAVRRVAVPAGTSPRDCARVGADLAGGPDRVALLAVGDGSARRGPKAPGYVDSRADGFDREVLDAVRAADPARLLAVDPVLAEELLAAGRVAWQVLAGALAVTPAARGDVLYAADPFGVSYLVATLHPARPA